MRTLATTALFAAVLIGVIGQFGQVSPIADAVNQFAPAWLAPGVTAALIALACRSSRTYRLVIASTGLVLIAIGARMVLPEFLHASPGMGGHRTNLSLVQVNAMIDNPDPASAAAWIAAQNADIVTIDEARQAGGVLVRLRKVYPFQFGCLDHDRCSTAVLTRSAPLAIVPLAHGDPDNRGGLSAIGVVVSVSGKPTLVIATHFNRPWPFKGYDRSLQGLIGKLRSLPPMPTVVAGDFNMTPWTFAMAAQDRLIDMPRLTRAIPTWPATFLRSLSLPILPIDHVYARGLHAIRIVRGPPIGSDHLPLRLDLALDGPSAASSS